MRQAFGVERLAKCRVFVISRQTAKSVLFTLSRDEPKESPARKAGKGETGSRESVKHGKGTGLGLAETKKVTHTHFYHFRVCARIEGKPIFAEQGVVHIDIHVVQIPERRFATGFAKREAILEVVFAGQLNAVGMEGLA